MAEIINMPREQMLNALRRDPALYVQTVFPFVELDAARAEIIRMHKRSTSEIWNDLWQCKLIDDGDPRRAELIEELNERT